MVVPPFQGSQVAALSRLTVRRRTSEFHFSSLDYLTKYTLINPYNVGIGCSVITEVRIDSEDG